MTLPDYDTAAQALKERVGEKAFSHSENVARTAGDLALIYGVDPEQARLAGLLHDWDRELTGEELLSAAAVEDIAVTWADECSPRLLHARTGALALTRAFPGLSDEIVRSVELHTLGAVEMSALDMIVYVADMIEPGRAYKGVDDLRETAGTVSLEALFAGAYQQSVLHLVRARKPIHPDTVAVWNAHVARSES